MAFDGTPKVIDARRECQQKFKALPGGQRYPLFRGAGRLAGIRHDLNAGADNEATLKTVRFPALIPYHQAHGLPYPHVYPSRREAKIVHDYGHLLIFGGTGREAQQESCQAFDHSRTPC